MGVFNELASSYTYSIAMEYFTAVHCSHVETSDRLVVPGSPRSDGGRSAQRRRVTLDDGSSGNNENNKGEEEDEEEEEKPAPKGDLAAVLADVINKEKSTHCCGSILAVKSGVDALGITETK
jgi:hypothetical protein